MIQLVLCNGLCNVTLHSGKNRQIRLTPTHSRKELNDTKVN